MSKLDSLIILDKPVKPMSFAALMVLYESNYQRVMHLLESQRNELDETEICFKHENYVVHCKVEEVTKYTALLCIDEDQVISLEPVRVNHFRVRLYHDALLAAVQSSVQDSSNYNLHELPLTKERIEALWTQNMFFNKWLDYCLDRKLVKNL